MWLFGMTGPPTWKWGTRGKERGVDIAAEQVVRLQVPAQPIHHRRQHATHSRGQSQRVDKEREFLQMTTAPINKSRECAMSRTIETTESHWIRYNDLEIS
jgi:hypothetical protein